MAQPRAWHNGNVGSERCPKTVIRTDIRACNSEFHQTLVKGSDLCLQSSNFSSNGMVPHKRERMECPCVVAINQPRLKELEKIP